MTKGYISVSDFATVVPNHLKGVEEEISQIRDRYPAFDDALAEYEEVARGQLPRRLELVSGQGFLAAKLVFSVIYI